MTRSKKKIIFYTADTFLRNAYKPSSFICPNEVGIDLIMPYFGIVQPNETKIVNLEIYAKLTSGKIHCPFFIIPLTICSNSALQLENNICLIEPDYNGPLHVTLWNNSTESVEFYPGDKFAQIVTTKFKKPKFNLITIAKKSHIFEAILTRNKTNKMEQNWTRLDRGSLLFNFNRQLGYLINSESNLVIDPATLLVMGRKSKESVNIDLLNREDIYFCKQNNLRWDLRNVKQDNNSVDSETITAFMTESDIEDADYKEDE